MQLASGYWRRPTYPILAARRSGGFGCSPVDE